MRAREARRAARGRRAVGAREGSRVAAEEAHTSKNKEEIIVLENAKKPADVKLQNVHQVEIGDKEYKENKKVT